MRVELRDSLENVFPDSLVAGRPRRRLALDVARNATAAVHVLLNGVPAIRPLRLTVKENGRPVRGARWFRLLDVPVEENTGLTGFTTHTKTLNVYPHEGAKNAPNPHVIREAPFQAFDIMQPAGRAFLPGAATVALRLHVPIEAGARPGLRTFSLEVACGAESHSLTLAVQVHKPVVPPAGRDSLPYTNWFNYESIAKHHGLALWSEPYWRMLRKYADLLHRGRQNCVLITNPEIFKMIRGAPVLDRPRLRRLVNLFTGAGLSYVEGGFVAMRKEWTAPVFVEVMNREPATTPAGYATVEALCRQLYAEIERNGWRDRWFQHVADEPIPPSAADYRILSGIVRKFMPGLPLFDATQDPSLVGSVDMWCPQVQEYERDRKEYEVARGKGDKVWCYTCCFPGGRWLNRLLDQELLRPALLGWGVALYKLDGFLHWGLNWWQDDFRHVTSPPRPKGKPNANRLPPGDTHVIYPGAEGPLSSLRFEAQREGFEDHELLRRLQAQNPAAAARVLRMAIRGFGDYTKDVRRFRAARKALLKSLAVG